MANVAEHIEAADSVICANIATLHSQRDLLSQNILGQLRNLVEGVAVRLHTGRGDAEYNYDAIEASLSWVKANGRLNFVTRFHTLLKPSVSHYTFDGDTSERLMLRYYEYMLRLRTLLYDEASVAILSSLELFPLDQDPALAEYHEKISVEIDKPSGATAARRDRFYIHKTRPFITGGRVFYEVTFYKAVNRVSKADRIIGFTNIDIADNYSANLGLQTASIEVLGQQMPVTLIRNWDVSIRPCEVNQFTRLVARPTKVRTDSAEYKFVMAGLSDGSTLLDLIDAPDERYEDVKARGTATSRNPQIFPALDEARRIIRGKRPGHNLLRYLLLRMRNDWLKAQYDREPNSRLSDLKVSYSCIPFDDMPFCTAPRAHNPRFWDLINSLDPTDRAHELLARRVQRNVEDRGILYTPIAELEALGDVSDLIATYNNKLYRKHRPARNLVFDKGHVFIQSYEDDTYDIVTELQAHAASGISGYTAAVEQWLGATAHTVDDSAKRAALTGLFAQSRVALVYGAAGTGKTRMVDHIAHYFGDNRKLFLANTHPAVENLRRRVSAPESTFRTIASHKHNPSGEFDLLVIDECSTVSNADILYILKKTSFKLIVFVGDVFQIESIRFGNWFNIVRSYIEPSSIFELATPYRASSDELIDFWTKVRTLDEGITEAIARNGYSTALDASLFDSHSADDIILALNYDGLYGINNINRFLQAGNTSPAVPWGPTLYKAGDPVLFADTNRFKPLIYNNLKGTIVDIQASDGSIQFDVRLDRPVTELDVEDYYDLQWVSDSTVRFAVYDIDISDEDDDTDTTTVPFQVAYAVGIHKAQGLEYDAVKVVITSANEDDVTHNIFYTAVTRARQDLRIYWSPETQQAVISGFRAVDTSKDVALLSSRRGLTPIRRRRP
ncbi:ATP-dependent DNA helicase [Kocuria rhizophila]|uniref:ATP-dependent DNA helicase n=1 Tax=Kocuria rhizophila TaxID=72000 RepID=UPI00073D3A80|nr:ATP-dependent RecD-like DNA helicase [Kocuria rhizophila]